MNMLEKIEQAILRTQGMNAHWQAAHILEVLREPTEEMVKAGKIPTREISLSNGMTTTGLGLGADFISCWKRAWMRQERMCIGEREGHSIFIIQ